MWVRFNEIPSEFWHPNILTGLVKAVFLVRIDSAMANKDLVKFVCVLIEIDFSHPLPAEIIVDRDNESAVIGVSYERLPKFCDHCLVSLDIW